jgi:cytochrome b
LSEGGAAPAAAPIRVWDWPTRCFHWALVLLFGVQWWSGKAERIDLHIASGLALIALLLFRLVWGLIGGSTARFSNFVRGPRALVGYLRGTSRPAIGHNPLGGWSVIAMLALLAVQAGLGLFASDEDAVDAGPLSDWVSFEAAQLLLENHETLFNILLGLIGLHVAAILYYRLRGEDLVSPMLSGRRAYPSAMAPLRPAPAWRLVAALAVAAPLPLWLAWRWLAA